MVSSVLSRRTLLRGVGLAVAGGAAAAACGPFTDSGPVARFRRAGEVRIGYAELAPYTAADPRDGAQTVGAAAALTTAVFDSLGVRRIDWRRRDLHALPEELRAGKIDLVATPLPIAAVDCTRAAATAALMRTGFAAVTAPGATADPAQIAAAGGRVGTLAGFPVPTGAAEVTAAATIEAARTALAEGRVDALVLPAPAAHVLAGDLAVTALDAPPVDLVLQVRAADAALAYAYDEAVGALPDRVGLVTAAGLPAEDLVTAPDRGAIPYC